jgi:hypothetical protein
LPDKYDVPDLADPAYDVPKLSPQRGNKSKQSKPQQYPNMPNKPTAVKKNDSGFIAGVLSAPPL